MAPVVTLIGVEGLPELREGDDLALMAVRACEKQGTPLQEGDILVFSQKVVSKAEGRLVDLRTVTPSDLAHRVAERMGRDPRHMEVVLRESRGVVRMTDWVLISETHHGFRCANAGVDASNVPGEETVCLLPEDPDASALRLHRRLGELTGLYIPVVITDTWGRPWREGVINFAVGVAGLAPLLDLRGAPDMHGRPLQATVLATADEIAAASGLAMPKAGGVPVVVVRGYRYEKSPGSARGLIRPAERDLFR